ncbi:uroporphyrinogen-III C-methyltransferase [Alcaligenes aquatilis]|uniref:Uroporphyrinogen-III C-methyltransferase n=1 Tax=Alcaligenes aquatilis TaxID=323284 RepID=A0ABY4NCX3_9BURK|nr:uroporphyrinogen-III C-methyltransferase [Alcaligenes aquatilis]UQN34641.1 uroporphyrinogen-III C-methyltransferase [Alcaligenes aquatilis]
MNDKTENASASEPETPISSPASTPASRPYSDPKESTTTPEQRKSGAGPAYALTAVVVVLAAAGLWYQNSLLEKHKAELQAQLATNINTTEQARQTAQQALALAQRQSDKLAQLEKSFNDSTEQFHDLSQAFQTMTDSGSELVLLNDIDHLATIAQQQLMLGGNVANAIVSLEAAQAQLARANRVGLASLQQTLNGDLERLRAAATVDVASLSRQLDTLSRYVSEAPLLVPDDVAGGANTEALDLSSEAVASAELPADAPWWERSWNTVQQWGSSAWRSVSHDLGQFVSIRRVDDAAALLMSPDQAARLRENLRLRIMAAQLAMMMNQSAVWQTELNAVATALEKRFDTQSNQVQQALRLTRQLQDTRIGARLPTVNNTLAAIESLRQAQAGRSQNNTDDTTTEQGDTGPVPSDSPQSTEPAKQEEPAAEQAESGAPAQAETEQPAQAQG